LQHRAGADRPHLHRGGGAPLITFGCAYYPWSWLRIFPVLQFAVLFNPLVYANEGLRGAMSPQIPHIQLSIAIGALV